jgi:hypothetical protein
MSLVQRTVCKCDYPNCEHEWLAASIAPPEKCSKCRRRGWNSKSIGGDGHANADKSTNHRSVAKVEPGAAHPVKTREREKEVTGGLDEVVKQITKAPSLIQSESDIKSKPWLATDPETRRHLHQFEMSRGEQPETVAQWEWFLKKG